nr:hypothetical protein [Maliibacterium massiliense]
MRKFIIPAAPQSSNKSIRFPFPLIARIERWLPQLGCSFSGFVLAAVRYALDDLEAEQSPPSDV